MKLAKMKAMMADVVEGPMGLRMPAGIAKQIEEASKGLPKDFVYRRRATKTIKSDFVPGERADISYITSDSPDREDDVVLPDGGDWADYNKVVTWCHSYGPVDGWIGLPVGGNMWMKTVETEGGKAIAAKTMWYSKPPEFTSDWLPDAIVHLQKQTPPSCIDKSIGFIPCNMRLATKSECALRPEWEGKVLIDRWKGFEYAACPIGMNQDASVFAVAKSLSEPMRTTVFAKVMPNLVDDDAENVFKQTCPKCMKDMAEDGGAYTCSACSTSYTLDDAGKPVEKSKPAPKAIVIDAPVNPKAIPSFLRPETIAKAVAEKLKAQNVDVAAKTVAALEAYMAEAMGRP